MFELLRSMLREEVRLHEALFDRRFFFMFPFAIAGLSYILSLFMRGAFGGALLLYPFIGFFAVYGLMVGAVGLHAKDALSIRFNDLSLLLYSSRSLPLSRKMVLLTFAFQDLIYYMILTVIPFAIGADIGGACGSLLFCMLGLSSGFMAGLSLSFLISALYSRFGKLFGFLLAVGAYVCFVYMDAVVSAVGGVKLSFFNLAGVLGISLFLLCVAGFLFDFEAGLRKSHRFRESFLGYSGLFMRFSLGKRSFFAAKDMLDMGRTSGGFAKIVFSYLFPSVILWAVFDAFLSGIGIRFSVVTFAVVLGVVSTSIYNWLCQYDRFSGYSIYPVSKRDVIVSKIISFALLSSVFSVVALLGVCVVAGDFSGLLFGLIVMFSSASYVLAVLVRVAGLEPNAVLYDVRALIRYFAYCLPVLAMIATLSFFDLHSVSWILVVCCIVTSVVSVWVFRSAIDFWES